MASTPAADTPEISVADYVVRNDEIAQAPALLAPENTPAPATAIDNHEKAVPEQRDALTGKQEHCKL